MLLDCGVGTVLEVLEAHMGEGVLPTNPTRGNIMASTGVAPKWGHFSMKL